MVSLLLGMLVVVAGAAGFGLALFGRRPVPQTATQVPGVEVGAETLHRPPGAASRALAGVRVLVGEREGAGAEDVQPSRWVRVRAALLLLLTVLGLAAIIGGVLSVLVVGLVLLAT
jgi:hypothetical protein